MEPTWNNGGMTPSAIALKNSLSQKPDTLSEPTMLTPYQQELLRQGEKEIEEYVAQSPHLAVLIKRLRAEMVYSRKSKLSADEEAHLEQEFADYEQRYPRE